ncbi:hypothetical protein [Hansschlegelia beijingensis]|uniref:DUF2188 domain-containing protein n=1 Tax=Hansschlegelia beijingensis TaxID=1133344 RepID=A0A7W6GF00_9HYPH|nr:hypothetical protein [Hansschlegelia beijingensis]MBB3972618.1 hypothetical protein [Hansschlegelia beijingensis]
MLKPVHITEDRDGAKAGWWAVDEHGTPVFGPYPTREAVLVHIAEKRGADQIADDNAG